MPRKLTREQAMCELIDALCPLGPYQTFSEAQKLAALCETVAALYERGGSVLNHGLGLSAKPASTSDAFWRAARLAARQELGRREDL
jgi:hypothetical protein